MELSDVYFCWLNVNPKLDLCMQLDLRFPWSWTLDNYDPDDWESTPASLNVNAKSEFLVSRFLEIL